MLPIDPKTSSVSAFPISGHHRASLREYIEDPARNNFNFIRLIASLLVLLTHCFVFYPSRRDPVSVLSNNLFTGAWLGVCSFFFLSGLLVTQSIRQGSSIKKFAVRRFLRIYPPAWLVIFLCAFVLGPLLTTWKLSFYLQNADFHHFLLNIFLVRIQYTLPGVWEHSPAGPGLTSSFWSLCLEVKLYALLAFVYALKIPGRRVLGIWLLFAIFLFDLFFLNQTKAIFSRIGLSAGNPLDYTLIAPLFGIGVLCNVCQDQIIITKNWLGAILVLSGIFFYYSLLVPATFILIPIVILYIGTKGVKWIKKITPKADLSYGIYLFGVPVGKGVFIYFHPENAWIYFLMSAAAITLFAVLSWYGLERKLRALKVRLDSRRASGQD